MEIGRSIPTLGKFYISSSIVLSLLIFAKSLDPYSITYTFNSTIFQLALWRPITAVLYLSRIGLLLPFHLVFAYIAFSKAEQKVFPNGDRASLLWIFILSVILLSIFSTFSSLYFFGNSFIMILLMMWAVQYPTDTLKISKIYLQSIYFPLIYAALMVLLGSFLMGIFLGVFKNPTFIIQHGDRLPVPAFIKNYFMQQEILPVSPRAQMIISGNRRSGQYFQGAGYRIG